MSKIQNDEVVEAGDAKVNTPIEDKNSDMGNILRRLEALEAENKELKSNIVVKKKTGKDHYEGPRKYSYSLWGGVPVLHSESYRKDETKDLISQDQFGKWVSNHYVKLSLANGKEVSVEVTIFNRDRVRTEKLFCTEKTDEQGNKVYDFKTSDYGTISVLSSVIN